MANLIPTLGTCVLRMTAGERRLAERHIDSGSFNPYNDTIKLLITHASKGLEFAVAALPGVEQMLAPEDDEQDEARLFYVAAARATHRLVITASGDGGFGKKLKSSVCDVRATY